MSRDNSELLTEITKTIEEQMKDEVLEASDLEVIPVMIDFHSPDERIMVPMSWKLTTKQKNNVDAAWKLLLDGRHPHEPLKVLDDFFERAPSLPDGLTESSGSHQSAPTL